jgi:hypothetical protein
VILYVERQARPESSVIHKAGPLDFLVVTNSQEKYEYPWNPPELLYRTCVKVKHDGPKGIAREAVRCSISAGL